MSDTPEALRYAEARIVAALPGILHGMIARAEAGAISAAVYHCDRLMGGAAGASTAPADDRAPPYSLEAYRLDRAGRVPESAQPRIIIPDIGPRPSGANVEA